MGFRIINGSLFYHLSGLGEGDDLEFNRLRICYGAD